MRNLPDSAAALVFATLDALMARADFDFKLEATSTPTGTLVSLEERRSRKRFSKTDASSLFALTTVVTEAVTFVAESSLVEDEEEAADAHH
jgi:hypothetical protein